MARTEGMAIRFQSDGEEIVTGTPEWPSTEGTRQEYQNCRLCLGRHVIARYNSVGFFHNGQATARVDVLGVPARSRPKRHYRRLENTVPSLSRWNRKVLSVTA